MTEEDVEREEGFDCADEDTESDDASEAPEVAERSLEEDGYGYGV